MTFCSLKALLCPWNFPGKNTGVGCPFLLQEIFSIQGLNLGLSHCRQTLYGLNHQGSPGHMETLYLIFDLETFFNMMCSDTSWPWGQVKVGWWCGGRGTVEPPVEVFQCSLLSVLIAQNNVFSGRGPTGKISAFMACISKRQKMWVIAFSPMMENAFLPFNYLT